MTRPILAAIVLAAATPTLTDRTVDVSKAPIHIRCGGERVNGSPVVVLEAGAGNGADTWSKVQPAIAGFARVCAYDRPTLVRNAPTRPSTPTPDEVIATLDGVLTKAGEAPPYVLVGHSYGGMIVRLYAMRFRDRVSGMVLIDSSHEDQMRRFAEADPQAASMPPPATRFEAFDMAAMSGALAARPWHASIPLVVLTRSNQPPNERYSIWLDLQRELATRAPDGAQVIADHSGHYIQNDQPALVIDAVRRVVEKASRSGLHPLGLHD